MTSSQTVDNAQYDRRFKGTQTLYGQQSFSNFEKAHVIVIGVGGVGTWVAEGLARTAIGKMTLIDMDVLVASNVNRQLPALDSSFGKSKIEEMATRVRQINPKLELTLVDDFLTAIILDCTDDMSAKIAIALHCRFNKLKLICAGGAGGKTDPLQITVSDLKDTYQDPLLARLRSKLRNEHGINKQMKEKFGIKCVYSTQPPIVNKSADGSVQTGGLHCGGYGSAVAVTSVVGMVMVSETLALLSQ